MAPARGGQRVQGLAPLLSWRTTIHVGPRAESALRGERCVLLGSRRPRWVDVLEVGPRGGDTITSLVDCRFQAFGSWDAVGLSLPRSEAVRHRTKLLGALVPGDVLFSGGSPLIHMGDRWERAALFREGGALSKAARAT